MCRHLLRCPRLLVLCVDSLRLHYLALVFCLYVSTLQFHVSTLDHPFLKLWPLCPCVDSSISCVDTFISGFKSLSSIFMCRPLKVMCRHLHFKIQIFVHYLDGLTPHDHVLTPLVQNILPYFPWPTELQTLQDLQRVFYLGYI